MLLGRRSRLSTSLSVSFRLSRSTCPISVVSQSMRTQDTVNLSSFLFLVLWAHWHQSLSPPPPNIFGVNTSGSCPLSSPNSTAVLLWYQSLSMKPKLMKVLHWFCDGDCHYGESNCSGCVSLRKRHFCLGTPICQYSPCCPFHGGFLHCIESYYSLKDVC
jgi:hypothetical protein